MTENDVDELLDEQRVEKAIEDASNYRFK